LPKHPSEGWYASLDTTSTLPLQKLRKFTDVLRAHRIEGLADVRSLPGSRRHPQFNRDVLAGSLADAAIEYVWLQSLGGRRRAQADSHNTAWRNKSFQAYADYMETDEFCAGIAELLQLARARRTAVMCAEAVWWRCHRALISDDLKAQGVKVMHIFDADKTEEHPYTPAACVRDGRVSYEAQTRPDDGALFS
ncbi:MAG: DUF488 domain-containing protein, partial [Sedimentisphaerales bacterium]|nr:DUF488 domain-containing protein [Sedimentisphaerales bacterium]